MHHRRVRMQLHSDRRASRWPRRSRPGALPRPRTRCPGPRCDRRVEWTRFRTRVPRWRLHLAHGEYTIHASASAAVAAETTTSDGRPPSREGGEHRMISETPATRAGMAPIRTLLGYAARPPGAYTPTRRNGSGRRPTMTPGSLSTSWVNGRNASCTRRMLRAERSMARRRSGATRDRACAHSARATSSDSSATPSNSSAISL